VTIAINVITLGNGTDVIGHEVDGGINMNGSSRRAGRDPARRLGVTAMLAAQVTLTGIALGVALTRPTHATVSAIDSSPVAAQTALARAPVGAAATPAVAGTAAAPATASTVATPAASPAAPAAGGPVSLALTAADHRDCPATATACADLSRHLTWLQHDGKVTFGPVQMEPGHPTGAHQTPRGTFHVSWKAGPGYVSTAYHEAMPWATFFAAGGIAFHGGSLTASSHGCLHLTVANAHYFQEHLPIGADVVVF
jgi:L,D-transpeptidase catalytic domain